MTQDARACRVQAKKDPNEPKRAKSSYMLFCDEQRAKVKAENPELSMTGAAACLLCAPFSLAMPRAAFTCQQPSLASSLHLPLLPMRASPRTSSRRPCGPLASPSAVGLSRHCAARYTSVRASECVWGMGGCWRAEMSKVIGAKWKELSAEEKKPFEDEVRRRCMARCVPQASILPLLLYPPSMLPRCFLPPMLPARREDTGGRGGA